MKSSQLTITTFLLTLFLSITTTQIYAQTCYITKSGIKYHRASCSYLTYSASPIDMSKAISAGYTACSRCKPTTNSLRSTSSQLLNNYPISTNTIYYKCQAVQCSGTTQKGRRCRNTTKDCSGRCHYHR